MRREDILALAEENRRLREEVSQLEEELFLTHQEEATSLRQRLTALEQRAASDEGAELRATRGAISAVLAGVALSLGLAGGLASLLFAAAPRHYACSSIKTPIEVPAAQAPQNSRLFVTGEPVNAPLRLDGEAVGQAPLLITIEPGHHTLEILNDEGEVADKMELFAQPQQTARATYHTTNPSEEINIKPTHRQIHFIDHFVETK